MSGGTTRGTGCWQVPETPMENVPPPRARFFHTTTPPRFPGPLGATPWGSWTQTCVS